MPEKVYEKWTSATQHKQFFDALAKKNGFDPRDVDSWYNVTNQSVIKEEVWEYAWLNKHPHMMSMQKTSYI